MLDFFAGMFVHLFTFVRFAIIVGVPLTLVAAIWIRVANKIEQKQRRLARR